MGCERKMSIRLLVVRIEEARLGSELMVVKE